MLDSLCEVGYSSFNVSFCELVEVLVKYLVVCCVLIGVEI